MFKKGFTLIELLVVIAIIAILAAILFPVFAQAREKARQTSCLSNCKQIGTALQLYVDDYDETLPCLTFQGIYRDTTNGYGDNQVGGVFRALFGNAQWSYRTWTWMDAVAPYVKNGSCFHCPSTSPATYKYGGNTLIVTSYGYNPYLTNPIGTSWADANFMKSSSALSLSSIKSTAGIVFCCDTAVYKAADTSTRGWLQGTPGTCYGLAYENIPGCANRHNGGINFTFCDGHAKYYKVNQGPLEIANYNIPNPSTEFTAKGTWCDKFGSESTYWNPAKNQ